MVEIEFTKQVQKELLKLKVKDKKLLVEIKHKLDQLAKGNY